MDEGERKEFLCLTKVKDAVWYKKKIEVKKREQRGCRHVLEGEKRDKIK